MPAAEMHWCCLPSGSGSGQRVSRDNSTEVHMKDKVDPVVDEAIETLNMKDGPARRKLLKGAGLFSATAAASALISACTSSSNSSAGAAKKVAGNFPTTP